MSVAAILILIAQVAAAWLLVSVVVTVLLGIAGYRLKQARCGSPVAELMSRPRVPRQRAHAKELVAQTRSGVHPARDASGVGPTTR